MTTLRDSQPRFMRPSPSFTSDDQLSNTVHSRSYCYLDLVGDSDLSQVDPVRVRPTDSARLPCNNASYELARFLRTTGPEPPREPVPLVNTAAKRSKSLPRRLLSRLAPKVRQNNDHHYDVDHVARSASDAQQNSTPTSRGASRQPPSPTTVPSFVVQKTTSNGKKYLALELPKDINGSGFMDMPQKSRDSFASDTQATERAPSMTSDQLIDEWLYKLEKVTDVKSLQSVRLSTASSLVMAHQHGTFVPTDRFRTGSHPALRGPRREASPTPSLSGGESLSSLDDSEHVSVDSVDSVDHRYAEHVTPKHSNDSTRRPAGSEVMALSPSSDAISTWDSATTPTKVSSSQRATSELFQTPPAKMLTGPDGRRKSMSTPLNVVIMESMIDSMISTLHAKTPKQSGLPTFVPSLHDCQIADRRDSVCVLSKFHALSADIPVQPADVFVQPTPPPSSVRRAHSRKDSKDLLPRERRHASARITEADEDLDADTIEPAVQRHVAKRNHIASCSQRIVPRQSELHRRRIGLSTGSPRSKDSLFTAYSALQDCTALDHALRPPRPAPDKALPPLPTRHPSRSRRANADGVQQQQQQQQQRRNRTPTDPNTTPDKTPWIARTTPARKNSRGPNQISRPGGFDDSYAVNRTPPLASPLVCEVVDLDVLEDHLVQLQYKASQLSALVMEIYNMSGTASPSSSSVAAAAVAVAGKKLGRGKEVCCW
ncbi:hypothetical protein LTR62_007792 [Meristemomyces frigidus]|uniref:Uncharacterized protein n=1 Tax=Meristemomyces frigidus TaxID=1508187 RepID=A0AAN7TA69_9PEZI|nr:hypothetical protein LTR62_007792 [Meristemomyces frigidus]